MTQSNNQNPNPQAEVSGDMPLLNASGASAKNTNMISVAGFIVIAVIGIGIGVWMTANQKKDESKKPQTSEIRNGLPSINYQEPLPLPVAVSKPVVPQAQLPVTTQTLPPPATNTKPVITPVMRKMNGDVVAVGKSQPKQEQGTAIATTPNADKSDSELSNSLKSTKIAGVSAAKLPNRNFLITKGSTLGCVLETALDSSLSGLATCRLIRDVYSTNGSVILLDKGSKIVGEYQGGMKRGQKRLFLLWSRVETPNGVIINIDSPSIDPVGRTGVDGWVDNHFADRFGAAILVTLLQDVAAAGTSYLQGLSSGGSNSGGSSTTINTSTPQAGTEVVKSMLSSSANIPPTLNKNQGDEIQIMIARDLDFSNIYALKVNHAE